MTRFGFDAVGAYVLTVALAAILIALLVSQLQRSKRAFAGGLACALVGVLLGCIIPVAMLKMSGYIVLAGNVFWVDSSDDGDDDSEEDSRQYASEMRRGGGPTSDRGAGSATSRDLVDLIARLELLTGDVRIALSEEQSESLAAVLNAFGPLESMSEADAANAQEAILAVLDDEQEARLGAVRLARRRPDGNEGLAALNRLKERVGAKTNSDSE